MKKLMTLILGVVFVWAFSGLLAAEQESAKSTQSNPSEQTMEKASPKLMTGKITQIDNNGRTFMLASGGKHYRFSYEKIELAHKLGHIVDVTYVVQPGGQMEATSLNSSKSSHY